MVVIMVTMTIPAFAETTSSGDQTAATPTPAPSATPIPSPTATPTANNNVKLEKLKELLKKANAELLSIESRIRAAIEKAKDARDKKTQNDKKSPDNADSTQEKLQESLDKLDAQEKNELDSLKNDITKQTEYITKYKATLQQRLTNIDSNLQKQLADLDKKIAAATNDETKQKLQTLKEIIQKYAADQKVLLNKYINDLTAFWKEKQQLWEERLALLLRRQGIEKDFRIASITLKKNELAQYNANLPKEQLKTDAQIEKEIRDKFQKNIETLKKRIQEIQSQITKLSE